MGSSKQIRKLVMAILVSVFLVQGWFVYTDKTGRRHAALSSEARRGQDVWQQQNCQTCHRLFGLGGFLGPDLTHVTERLPPEDFAAVLKDSPAPMPHYPLSDADAKALYLYLSEMDRAGKTQVPAKNNFNFSEIPWFSGQ